MTQKTIEDDRMLNAKEVYMLIGISPSHPKAKELRKVLPTYNNPFSSTKIFKKSDALLLIENFEYKEEI